MKLKVRTFLVLFSIFKCSQCLINDISSSRSNAINLLHMSDEPSSNFTIISSSPEEFKNLESSESLKKGSDKGQRPSDESYENSRNDENGSSGSLLPIRESLYIVIPMTLIYSLIFLTGLVGNVSTCIVIVKNNYMHTATNYYLFSLGCSDLLLLLSGLPQEMYSIWVRYPYIFGEAFCIIRGLAAETSANATVLTITAFTVERYVAICHPLRSHKLSQLSRVVRIIICIWTIALTLALPQAARFGLVDEIKILLDGASLIVIILITLHEQLNKLSRGSAAVKE